MKERRFIFFICCFLPFLNSAYKLSNTRICFHFVREFYKESKYLGSLNVWYDMVWKGMVWCAMVWYGIMWYIMV